jgi:outer membrane protein OmpA-like peptidoglycan-associated protein
VLNGIAQERARLSVPVLARLQEVLSVMQLAAQWPEFLLELLLVEQPELSLAIIWTAEIERDIEGAKVERVGEGIKITFSSGILFDVDKADLKDYSRAELAKLATILNKYDDTNILLAGHTDSTGSDEYNLKLSRRRAKSVSDYLSIQNVNPERSTVYGYGKSDPIASNDTVDGRAQNRRVEVAIWANEKLKKVAQEKNS